MNSVLPKVLQKPLPAGTVSAIRLVVLSPLIICLLIITPVLAFPRTTPKPAIEQDDEILRKWVTLTPTGARASFRMPKKPKYVERSFSPIQDEPPIKVRLHMATVAQGSLTYVFVYHDLHEKPKDKKTANAALDGAVKGSVANVLGQLIDANDLIGMKKNPEVTKIGKHPGRLFFCRFIQNEKQYIVAGKVFLVEKRMYQLNCIMAEDVFDQFLAHKFFNSFKIIVPEYDLPPRPRSATTN